MGSRAYLLLGLACAVGFMAPHSLQAQGSGDGFLFKVPSGDLRLHGGFARANAGSDLFSYTRELLTLDRGDFSGPTVGADVGIRLSPRLDLVVGGSYASRSVNSEHRDWVDNQNLPIEQTTEFQRVPLIASARMYLAPRGRSIGSYAWVPATLAPYVGVGAGTMWYRFRQVGDFVLRTDLPTPPVVPLTLESSGWTPAAQAMAGVDFSLTPRIAVIGEARYLWSRADLDQNAFADFQPIDLSGITASIGLSLRL